jgi:hypothetical protein
MINLCDLTSIITNDLAFAIGQLERKFTSLTRLADILEKAGDGLTLPNINSLVPIPDIDAGTLAALLQICPFLSLPSLPTLQAQLSLAYLDIISSLLVHPYNRLNQLQVQLNKLQAKFNSIINTGPLFGRCQGIACPTPSPVPTLSPAYTAANGQVLSPTQQTKANNVAAMIATVKALIISSGPIPTTVNEFVPEAIPNGHPIPAAPIYPVI